jgi:hypothetical protein
MPLIGRSVKQNILIFRSRVRESGIHSCHSGAPLCGHFENDSISALRTTRSRISPKRLSNFSSIFSPNFAPEKSEGSFLVEGCPLHHLQGRWVLPIDRTPLFFPTDKSGWARGGSSCGLVSQPIVQQAYFSAILSPIESSSASMIFKPVSVILTTSVTHDSNFVF